jgi:hypothetical protein
MSRMMRAAASFDKVRAFSGRSRWVRHDCHALLKIGMADPMQDRAQ